MDEKSWSLVKTSLKLLSDELGRESGKGKAKKEKKSVLLTLNGRLESAISTVLLVCLS